MKIWSLPKHENLTTSKKYCGNEEQLLLRSNFPSFPQYFQYISNFKSPIHIYLLNVVNRIIFSWTLQTWYVEVWISPSILESPLELEITRVDYSVKDQYTGHRNLPKKKKPYIKFCKPKPYSTHSSRYGAFFFNQKVQTFFWFLHENISCGIH